jgi:N-acetylglucosaminyldiphosphoundecaprenol N-acetyl-beta-D-mannosaminyltransferase
MPTLLGMPIHAVTISEVITRTFDGVAAGRGGTVISPNIDIVRQYRSSTELQSVFDRTDLLVPDGMPLVVAARLQRTPLPQQITGTDLLWAACAEAAARGRSVFFAGGHPGDADRAVDAVRRHLPNLRAQTCPCYVTPATEAAQLAELSRFLVAANPDIVFIGLPFRTQVSLMGVLRAALPATWFIGVGSSFELVNGDRSRPPAWVQRLCLEWAWRLMRQPYLWRRYLVDDMPTAALLAVAALRTRWRGPPDPARIASSQTLTSGPL